MSTADRQSDNRRKSRLLIAGAAITVGLVVFLLIWLFPGLGFLPALLIGVAVAVTDAILVWRYATGMVLRDVKALLADEVEHARLFNTVDGLCVANGVARPELYVIDDVAPNALACGLSAGAASIAVTTGMLDALRLVEFEGVVAHLLSRIKQEDIALDTAAAVVVAWPLAPFGGLAESIVLRLRGHQRSVLADLEGVAMTRYPPGLASALARVRAEDSSLRSPGRVSGHLWIDESAAVDEAGFSLDDRVAVLQEL